MTDNAITIMRLLEFTDSAFPVGTFSFSNGLETAADMGLVHDAVTLEKYTQDIAIQAAYTDGIALLHAHRAYVADDYSAVVDADNQVILCKMNTEARQMTQRMGKKMVELAQHIFGDPIIERWIGDINATKTPGTFPVAQAIVFGACDIDEHALFCSHQYGVMNMVLSAALRCVKVSHYDTQRILFRLSEQAQSTYDEVRQLDFQDMNMFVPQIDILASLHEKGTKRMFMN